MKPDVPNKTFGIANKHLLIGVILLLVIGIPAFGVVSMITADTSNIGNILTITYSGTSTSTVQSYFNTAGISEIVLNGDMTIDTINVPSNIHKIRGSATIRQSNVANPTFNITSSDIEISELNMVGAGESTFNTNAIAINVSGSSGTNKISNVNIHDLNISHYVKGIWMQYVDNFNIYNNKISHLNYSGILVLSSSYGHIYGNSISDLYFVPNAYGIALSRASTSNDIIDPPSTDIAVSGNHVENNTIWEAYDTHAGRRIVFIGNTANNTKICFGVGVSTGSDGYDFLSAYNVNVIGNSCDSAKRDGTAGAGIVFTGNGTPGVFFRNASNGSIIGNDFIGYGTKSSATSGAIFSHNTQGLIIADNNLKQSSPNGIMLYYNNINATITGNTITDTWSDAVTTRGILTSSFPNSGTISSNTISNSTQFSATHLNDEGITLNSDTHNVFNVFGNMIDAVTRYQIGNGNTRSMFTFSYAGAAATTSDIQVGECSVWFDSGGATTKLTCNVGGALKTVALV